MLRWIGDVSIDRGFEVKHPSTGGALNDNRAVVLKSRVRAIWTLSGKETGKLNTKMLNGTVGVHVISQNFSVGWGTRYEGIHSGPFSTFTYAPGSDVWTSKYELSVGLVVRTELSLALVTVS